jgi:hypothetical protein
VLVQNRQPLASLGTAPARRAAVASVAGRTADLLTQRVRTRFEALGAALQAVKRSLGRASSGVARTPVGDIGFDPGDVDLAISALSTRLLQRFDYASIRDRRARNFRAIAAAIGDSAPLLYRDLPEGACPLFVPMLVDDKPAAAAALRDRGIQALEFWNTGASAAAQDEGDGARFLRRHVLGLPVHQDLSPRQTSYVAETVARFGRGSTS